MALRAGSVRRARAQFGLDRLLHHSHPPWLEYLQSWLFGALIGITVIVAIGHFLQERSDRRRWGSESTRRCGRTCRCCSA